jgi:hypothetical protein
VPRLSVWWVRTALAELAVGLTLGALLLANKGVSFAPGLWRWLPVHIELLLLGWTLNLALGVAYWILPRFKAGAPRGAAWPAWAAFALLNAGIALVCVAPWLPVGASADWQLTGRIAEIGAAALFALHAWPRVRAFA